MNADPILAAILLNRHEPLAPHHVGVLRERLGYLTDEQLRELVATGKQPAPVAPMDEELLELMPETMKDEFCYAAECCSDLVGGQVEPDVFRTALTTVALEYARAVLGRWGGRQPAPVAGEESLLRAVGLYTDSIDEAKLAILAMADWIEQLPTEIAMVDDLVKVADALRRGIRG